MGRTQRQEAKKAGAIAETIEDLPDHIRSAVTAMTQEEDSILLQGPKEQLWLPTPVPNVNYFLMARGYTDRMMFKYQHPDFVVVEPGDVVVDCGAYVGAFALGAIGVTPTVFAVEPAPVNFKCLQRNTQATSIEAFNVGLFDEPGEMEMRIGANSTDNSLIALDSDEEVGVEVVQVITVDDLRSRMGVDVIDFFKVEAEGVELEILQHVQPETVRKLAIDAGPERFGRSPFLDIAVLLANRGYRLSNRNYWLYARAE